MNQASSIRHKFKTNIRLLKLERKTKGGGGGEQVPALVKKMLANVTVMYSFEFFVAYERRGVGLKGEGGGGLNNFLS